MTITTAPPHGYSVGGMPGTVVLTGLGFTCDIDNGASIHYYPRHRDDAYNAAISIGNTTDTSIRLDVGISPYNESYAHTFASATTGAVVSGAIIHIVSLVLLQLQSLKMNTHILL